MDKEDIAAILRKEVGELEVLIKKLEARLARSKQLVLDIEAELTPEPPASTLLDGKFRTVVDHIFGEKPKRVKKSPPKT